MPYNALPSRAQWLRFKASRLTGILPESISTDRSINLQTYCLLCQIPIDISAVLPIRIGCLCKIRNEETIDAKYYNVGGCIYSEPARTVLTTKVYPMTTNGSACGVCGALMLKAEAQAMRLNRQGWVDVTDQVLMRLV